jgi:hypothetical protein
VLLGAAAMSSEVDFHYELTGTGWSECRLAIGSSRCQVTASYLSDALEELASAVEDVLRRPDVDARAVFMEEPGEYRWRFVHAGPARVRVKIIEFADWNEMDDAEGKVIFDAECDRRALGESVAKELRRLLTTHGARGYRKKWVENGFPTQRLEAIETLLSPGNGQTADEG